MKATFKIFLVVFFTFMLALSAQAQKMQAHILELQNRIESQIDRNLTNLISTQLAPTSFDVSTRVKVVEVPPVPPKPDPKKEIESGPAGMDLGSVDVREVIESYKLQIEELKAFKQQEAKPVQEVRYSVNRIEVVVGLADTYDDAYVAQFGEWLNKRVKLDYGAGAIATVNKAKPLPVSPFESAPLSWRDFLPMMAYALLAIAFVTAAWLLSRGLIRLGEGAKKIVVEHTNPFSLEHNQRIEQKLDEQKIDELKKQLPAVLLDEQNKEDKDLELLQAGEELIGKITYLCLELGKGVNDLVRMWLDTGSEGYVKTAVLIDMIVSLKEKVSAETEAANLALKHKYPAETAAAIIRLQIPLDADLASSYGVNLGEAYREAASMSTDSKLQCLEKIYWDLLQMSTLGASNMRKPFDYLQPMNDMAFSEALKAQPDGTKALALMFGDKQKAKTFMASIDSFEKERIVQNMMRMTQVSKKEIQDVDTAMKLKLINSSMNPEDSLVNLFPRTIDLLNTLSGLDEIRVLRKTVQSLPDKGLTVKQQHTTLAFIDEWNEEYVDRLVKVATSEELVRLLQVIPEAQNIVLGACPEKMKMIITDDLKMATQDENAMAKGIKSLKVKWKNICVAENLAMGKVLNLDSSVGYLKNAG